MDVGCSMCPTCQPSAVRGRAQPAGKWRCSGGSSPVVVRSGPAVPPFPSIAWQELHFFALTRAFACVSSGMPFVASSARWQALQRISISSAAVRP